MKLILVSGIVGLMFLVSGCLIATTPSSTYVGPAVVVAKSPNKVWVQGHYDRKGHWVKGHWRYY